jgi:hypothetical protein
VSILRRPSFVSVLNPKQRMIAMTTGWSYRSFYTNCSFWILVDTGLEVADCYPHIIDGHVVLLNITATQSSGPHSLLITATTFLILHCVLTFLVFWEFCPIYRAVHCRRTLPRRARRKNVLFIFNVGSDPSDNQSATGHMHIMHHTTHVARW